jgi:hypothetical protein
MAHRTLLIGLAIVIIVVVVGGYLSWVFLTSQNNPTPSPSVSASATPETSVTPTASPTPSPQNLAMEQLRDRTMVYIEANHSETVKLMENLTWTGGKQDTGLLVGSVTYLYSSGNWSFKIQHPVVPDPTYSITANYSSEGAIVKWSGTYQNQSLTETTSYISVADLLVLSTQEQMRDITMAFVKVYHNETVPYMQDISSWTGGRTTPEGLAGGETYSYESTGWNVTIRYPVVLNPTYTVTANYTSPISQVFPAQVIVSWQGTLQDGILNETAYNFNP